MAKIGIVIEPWKADLFAKGLTRANFAYVLTPGKTVTTITVETDLVAKLARFVESLQQEAAKRKQGHN